MVIQTRFDRNQKVWFRRGSLVCHGIVFSIEIDVWHEGVKVKYTIQYSEDCGVELEEDKVFGSEEEANCKVSFEEYKGFCESIEDRSMYDGRGKGVDVYECNKCGKKMFTKYVDKGVTPFCMPCECGGTMTHNETMCEVECHLRYGFKIIEKWVRPTYDQFVKLSLGQQEHVMNGGLLLEVELV